MIVAGSASPLLLSSAGGYNLTNSLRFRSSASAYLNRTFGSPTNNNKWTWSGWVKRGALGTNSGLFGAWRTTQGVVQCYFQSNDTLRLYVNDDTNTTFLDYQTSAVYRDPSAWYHVVISIDNTLATTSALIYINGTQVTAFGTSTNTLVQNAGLAWNFNGSAGYIGQNRNTANSAFGYFDGYQAEVNFIDGQQLTPSSFGQTSTSTGVWIPKKFSGTYGTNGFYLPFTDNSALTTSSNVGLGKDFSGNANYWTTNNISITAGTTYDSMTDVPTLTSATAANYATFNPLAKGSAVTLSDGNLKYSSNSASGSNGFVSMFMTTGMKTYFEITCGAAALYRNIDFGAAGVTYVGDSGSISGGTGGSGTFATWTTGDVVRFACDYNAGTIACYKNNTLQTTVTGVTNTSPWSINAAQAVGLGEYTANFGQQPFAYSVPTGFSGLNTFNLPTPTIGATASTQANRYMDAITRNGFGTSGGSVATNFQADLIWEKPRNFAQSHYLVDSVRGITSGTAPFLSSNSTSQEQNANWYNAPTPTSISFNSNDWGTNFTLVDWIWRAGGTPAVTNTAGTITSTVSANTSAGFSIATFTGNGTGGATVGHGLGVAPSMVIVKKRSGVADWAVQHISLGANASLRLNGTDATANEPWWNSTTPSSTVFTLGNSNTINQSGETFVAYCFAPVAGYSAFGSYTGNGSTDGPFIFTGFRPRFLIVKRTSDIGSWIMTDSARSTYNVTGELFNANTSGAEFTTGDIKFDYLSNGFKLREVNGAINASGSTYIYMAFAESPFKYANAR